MRRYYAFYISPTGNRIVHAFRSVSDRDYWVSWSECRRSATRHHPAVQAAIRKGLIIEHTPGVLARRRAERFMSKRRTR